MTDPTGITGVFNGLGNMGGWLGGIGDFITGLSHLDQTQATGVITIILAVICFGANFMMMTRGEKR